jgi:hypothetical protein
MENGLNTEWSLELFGNIKDSFGKSQIGKLTSNCKINVPKK